MKSKRLISLAAVIFSIFILSFSSGSDNAITIAHADFGGVSHSYRSRSHSHSHSHRFRHSHRSDGKIDKWDILECSVCGFVLVAYLANKFNLFEKYYNRKYYTIEPAFDKEEMKDHVKKVFTELQESWVKRNISSVRKYLSDNYYERNQQILQREYLDTDHYNIIEDIDIYYVKLTKAAKNINKYGFEAEIKVSMYDYVVKKYYDIFYRNELVSGSKDEKVNRIYRYHFECSENSANIEDWKINSIRLVKNVD